MTSLELVNSLLEKVYQYKKELDSINVEYSKAEAQVNEYKRQLAVHLGNNNQVDATIVKGWLQGAESVLLSWKIERDRVTALYENALAEYKDKKQTLLTAEEAAAASAAETIKAEQANAQSALQLKETQAQIVAKEEQAAKDRRNKMIMSGVIVVVVGVVLYFVYKKFIAKK